uniref:Uncharacterized protein n=1 Tax=viral metagenome TaxID=1070528 RepID=A0A6C0KUQ2_9ZZZZ
MKESMLLFIVLSVIVMIVVAVLLFTEKPANTPQVNAGQDVGDVTKGIISAKSLNAPSGSVIDYTKEESSGTSSGVLGFFKNLF